MSGQREARRFPVDKKATITYIFTTNLKANGQNQQRTISGFTPASQRNYIQCNAVCTLRFTETRQVKKIETFYHWMCFFLYHSVLTLGTVVRKNLRRSAISELCKQAYPAWACILQSLLSHFPTS